MTPFAWTDLLRFAEGLVADDADEVAQRTAINRAYYAAYHTAAAHVRRRGVLTSGHTHRRVWAVLIESADAGEADIGRKGDRLRLLRTAADYQNPFPGQLDQVANEALADANIVVEALRQGQR